MNLKLSSKQILVLAALGILILLIPFILTLTKQKQEIRKRAAGSGEVQIKLDPQQDSKQPGESFLIKVTLQSNQAKQVNAANCKLLYDKNIFDISTPTCGASFPTVAGNSVDSTNGFIYIGCGVGGGSSPVTVSSTPVILGQFQITIKGSASPGQTQISFAVTPQPPYVSDPDGNNLSDAGTPGVYTITSTSAKISGDLTIELPAGVSATKAKITLCEPTSDGQEWDCSAFKKEEVLTNPVKGTYHYEFEGLTEGKRYAINAIAFTTAGNLYNQGKIVCPERVIGLNKDICKMAAPSTQFLLIMDPATRCALTIEGGQTHFVGEQVKIYLTQNPRCFDKPECYYNIPPNVLEVKVISPITQTICAPDGFGPGDQTKKCTWNTNDLSPGEYTLKTTYQGHGDNCDTGDCCCDSDYDCNTTITLNPPSTATPTATPSPTATPTSTPTPTGTVTPTPTVTIPPGQVKIQVKIKFAGINEKRANQSVRVKIGRGEAIIQDLGDVSLTANDQGIYQSEMVTLSSAVTAGSNYYVLIKGPKHLQARYCQNSGQSRPCTGGRITLNNEENILDFSGYPLPGGDLPPQDGVVNALDAVALTNCFETPTSQACLDKADLNLDSVISVADQIIMNNTIYTRWEDE